MEEYIESYKKIWANIGRNEGPDDDMEFDFICSDQNGHLGIFTSFNRGYVPPIIKDSFEEYCGMIYEVDHLPIKDIGYKNPKNRLMIELSAKGFYVFDNGSVSYGLNKSDYVKDASPKNPLNINDNLGKKYKDLIPMLDLKFEKYDLIENLEAYLV